MCIFGLGASRTTLIVGIHFTAFSYSLIEQMHEQIIVQMYTLSTSLYATMAVHQGASIDCAMQLTNPICFAS
jgi:hypothetical protein